MAFLKPGAVGAVLTAGGSTITPSAVGIVGLTIQGIALQTADMLDIASASGVAANTTWSDGGTAKWQINKDASANFVVYDNASAANRLVFGAPSGGNSAVTLSAVGSGLMTLT